MPDEKKIIDLKAEKTEEGEIRYTRSAAPASFDAGGWAMKILGIALGVAIFLALLTFFVYVIIPLILLVILWNIISGFFRSKS